MINQTNTFFLQHLLASFGKILTFGFLLKGDYINHIIGIPVPRQLKAERLFLKIAW